MASLARITNNFFVTLINRLGVRPPFTEGFELSNVVSPVSIVDADIPITAIATTATLGSAFTAGELVAPAAGVRLADTLALPAGDYNVTVWVGTTGNVAGNGLDFRVGRRNAADAAYIWSQLFGFNLSAGLVMQLSFRATLQLNERFVVETRVSVAGATSQANIWASL